MIDNTTELLSIITKSMSEKGIELDHVDLYEQAVSINNKVKVCIGHNWVLVHKVGRGGGTSYYSTVGMLDKVLELLKPTINKGDYVADDYTSGILIKIDEDKYNIVDFISCETIYHKPKSLKELERQGWKKVI